MSQRDRIIGITLEFDGDYEDTPRFKKIVDDLKKGIVFCKRIEFRALNGLNFNYCKTIRPFAKDVKELEINLRSIKAKKLIKLLKMMPKLEKLHFAISKVGGIHKLKDQFEFPCLKNLQIDYCSCDDFTHFELFNKIFPQNSMIEFEIEFNYSKKMNEKHKQIEAFFHGFFSRQKMIKKLSSYCSAVLKAAVVLDLDEIDFSGNTEIISKILLQHPNLKVLRASGDKMHLSEIIDDVCALSVLEGFHLFFGSVSSEDADKMKKLANLKDLTLCGSGIDDFSHNFFNEQRSSLQKLFLRCINIPELLENMSSLVVLNCGNTTMKLNTILKYLPKLEELSLYFMAHKSKFCELDTEIVHKSLKKLDLDTDGCLSDDNIEEVLEIFQICPNLEDLNLELTKRSYGCTSTLPSEALIDLKFFEKLNEVKSLRCLMIWGIHLKGCSNYFPQIAEELKKLSRNVKNVVISIKDKLEDEDENFSYQPLIELITDHYDVDAIDGFGLQHELEIDCGSPWEIFE